MADGKLFQSRAAAAANVFVSERTLCATDDQCWSVGPAGVGDESAVVSQAWDVAGQTPMNKRDDLVVDALTHWKPVQLAKHR